MLIKNEYKEITIQEFGMNSKSKKEVFDLLCNEGDIFISFDRFES